MTQAEYHERLVGAALLVSCAPAHHASAPQRLVRCLVRPPGQLLTQQLDKETHETHESRRQVHPRRRPPINSVKPVKKASRRLGVCGPPDRLLSPPCRRENEPRGPRTPKHPDPRFLHGSGYSKSPSRPTIHPLYGTFYTNKPAVCALGSITRMHGSTITVDGDHPRCDSTIECWRRASRPSAGTVFGAVIGDVLLGRARAREVRMARATRG